MMQCREKSFENHGARRIAAIGPFAGTHLHDDMMSSDITTTMSPETKSTRTASIVLKSATIHLHFHPVQGTISP